MDVPGATVRRFFPGGNTAYGFHSFYDQILPPEEATRILVVKGGPGVGKSTFMRAIAAEMAARGFALELLQCSSDNDSLDGAVFPEINVALVDGTAPHVVDPRYPGCVDEIVNLGEYWDEKRLAGAREAIIAADRRINQFFAQAYRFLSAAKEIRDGWAAMNAPRLREGRLNRCRASLIEELMDGRAIAERTGRARHLFASALTPDGPREYLADVFSAARKMIILRGEPGTGKSLLVTGLLEAAAARGLYAECFHCGFDPFRLEHLFFPELAAGVVTANEYHCYEPKGASVIEMEAFLDPAPDHLRTMAAEAREVFAELIARAVRCFSLAKEAHDAMESHYVAGMDFAGVERLRARTLERILSYAEGTLSRGRAGE